MNTTNRQQKKIGDRVKITGGQYRNQVGTLAAKERRAWVVELDDGIQVTVTFPMVVLIETSQVEDAGTRAPDSTAPVEEAVEASAEEPATDAPEEEAPQAAAEAETGTESRSGAGGEPAAEGTTSQETDAPDPVEEGASVVDADNTGISPEIAAMTVKELWALAKQRGVGVARTKADFYRIIKGMNPDEDLAALKGKALFDRVSELHISRLRSKAEMARLLSQ